MTDRPPTTVVPLYDSPEERAFWESQATERDRRQVAEALADMTEFSESAFATHFQVHLNEEVRRSLVTLNHAGLMSVGEIIPLMQRQLKLTLSERRRPR